MLVRGCLCVCPATGVMLLREKMQKRSHAGSQGLRCDGSGTAVSGGIIALGIIAIISSPYSGYFEYQHGYSDRRT